MKSPIAIILVIAILAIGGYFFMQSSSTQEPASGTEETVGNAMPVPGADTPEMMAAKEFVMTAYYDAKGKWFSVKEMSVKKGETVRVKITNTAGMHDFVIDEYGVKEELPLNKEVVVEFVADKVGSFEYYCSKPGHRAGGQFGTLTVTE